MSSGPLSITDERAHPMTRCLGLFRFSCRTTCLKETRAIKQRRSCYYERQSVIKEVTRKRRVRFRSARGVAYVTYSPHQFKVASVAAMLAVLGCCLAPLDLRAPAGIAISTWERTGYRFTASADLPEPLSASPSSSKVHRRRWSTSTMTMATSSSDYSVLGLQPGASRAELKAEYRKRAKSCHPDVNPTLAAAQEFRMLREVIPWLRHHRTLERTLTLSRSDGAGVRAADQR